MLKLFFPIFIAVFILVLPVENKIAASGDVDCDIQSGTCSKSIDGKLIVVFDITPKPVNPMEKLFFTVELKRDGKIVGDAEVIMDLSMPAMQMGENVKPLKFNDKNGKYEAENVIVRCPSGRKVWRATLTVNRAGSVSKTDFTFEVAK